MFEEISSEALFVLVFLLISFLSWITEKFKAARSGQIQRPRIPEPPEIVEEAPPPARTLREPRQADPMREILQSFGIPVEQPVEERPAQAPPPLPEANASREPPPPLPSERRPSKSLWSEAALPEVLSAAEREALVRLKRSGDSEVPDRRQRGNGSPSRASIRALLEPDNIQSAFVLKEILDRPRCFDPADP